MNEAGIEDRSSRRHFLSRAGAASGALVASAALGGAPALGRRHHRHKKKHHTVPIFKLGSQAPIHTCAPGAGVCTACNACTSHAANKIFASADAANAHRAHPGCRCGVYQAAELPEDTWLALFGPGGRIGVVDIRDPRVQAILSPKTRHRRKKHRKKPR
jgi:hypothetical protein